MKKQKTPTAWQKWEEIFDIDDWGNVCKIPYLSVRSTEIQSFQYKIINRILACNHWLHIVKIKDNNECTYCKKDDTIIHFLYECTKCNSFWHRFLNWWNKTADVQLDNLTCKDIIFGIYIEKNVLKILNFCILIAKKYIYDQKINSEDISLWQFLAILKTKIETELLILKKQEKFQELIVWTIFSENL